jgi:hypothetical protein
VSFAAVTLCVASQRVFIFVSVYFLTTQSEDVWIYTYMMKYKCCEELMQVTFLERL